MFHAEQVLELNVSFLKLPPSVQKYIEMAYSGDEDSSDWISSEIKDYMIKHTDNYSDYETSEFDTDINEFENSA